MPATCGADWLVPESSLHGTDVKDQDWEVLVQKCAEPCSVRQRKVVWQVDREVAE
jgi:hypothetical protein